MNFDLLQCGRASHVHDGCVCVSLRRAVTQLIIHRYSPFLVGNWNIQKWTDEQR